MKQINNNLDVKGIVKIHNYTEAEIANVIGSLGSLAFIDGILHQHDGTEWVLSGGGGVSNWSTDNDYVIGDLVTIEGKTGLYQAVTANTGNDPETDDGTNWVSASQPLEQTETISNVVREFGRYVGSNSISNSSHRGYNLGFDITKCSELVLTFSDGARNQGSDRWAFTATIAIPDFQVTGRWLALRYDNTFFWVRPGDLANGTIEIRGQNAPNDSHLIGAVGYETVDVKAIINPNVDILDEDDLVSDRDDAVATQQSVKAYVDSLELGLTPTRINTAFTVENGKSYDYATTADADVVGTLPVPVEEIFTLFDLSGATPGSTITLNTQNNTALIVEGSAATASVKLKGGNVYKLQTYLGAGYRLTKLTAGGVEDWDTSVSYEIGDIVTIKDNVGIYQAKAANSAKNPVTDADNWKRIDEDSAYSESDALLGQVFFSSTNKIRQGLCYAGLTYNWTDNPNLKALYDANNHDFITDNGNGTFTVAAHTDFLRAGTTNIGTHVDDTTAVNGLRINYTLNGGNVDRATATTILNDAGSTWQANGTVSQNSGVLDSIDSETAPNHRAAYFGIYGDLASITASTVDLNKLVKEDPARVSIQTQDSITANNTNADGSTLNIGLYVQTPGTERTVNNFTFVDTGNRHLECRKAGLYRINAGYLINCSSSSGVIGGILYARLANTWTKLHTIQGNALERDGVGDRSAVTVNLYAEVRMAVNDRIAVNYINRTGLETSINDFFLRAEEIVPNLKVIGGNNGGAVDSVNGKTGAVVLDTDDIDEGTTNLYYTEARVNSNAAVAANTSKVSADGSVTTHSDITSAGSGNIITSVERGDLNSNTSSRHDAVTLSAANDSALALNGQELTLTLPAALVDSVNGERGIIILDTDDINEGTTNLYYTEARVSANTDVAANTAKVSADGSVTTHNDITSAGSGSIITAAERGDITDNTSARHAAVTLSASSDNALTINGQELTLTLPAQTAAPVDSVNGETGAVVLDTGDIAENGNLYYTEARVDANTNVAANTAARHDAVTLGANNDSALALNGQELELTLPEQGVKLWTSGITYDVGDVVRVDGEVGLWQKQADPINFPGAGGSEDPRVDQTAAWVKFRTGNYIRAVNSVSTNQDGGSISIGTGQIPETGSNLYYTETRVTANATVTLNTQARHDAVTLASDSDAALTLNGQELKLTLPASNNPTQPATCNTRTIASSITLGKDDPQYQNITPAGNNITVNLPTNAVNGTKFYIKNSSATRTFTANGQIIGTNQVYFVIYDGSAWVEF